MISKVQKQIFQDNLAIYENLLPVWMEEYRQTGNMLHDPYVKNWVAEFTPIEMAVWQDIRSCGLPFYPQIPACGYFLDFANPFLKIAIECDGAEFHDYAKDSIRDKKLEENGWIVFRISGSKCKRILPDPFYCDSYDEDNPLTGYEASEWFNKTSTGIVYAIKQAFFEKNHSIFAQKFSGILHETLDTHVSTKSSYKAFKNKRKNLMATAT
jgi:very-short-patch-repair endonuclease